MSLDREKIASVPASTGVYLLKDKKGRSLYIGKAKNLRSRVLSYLGEGFTRLAFEGYYQGRLTKTQLATHLNINGRNIDKLEKYTGW